METVVPSVSGTGTQTVKTESGPAGPTAARRAPKPDPDGPAPARPVRSDPPKLVSRYDAAPAVRPDAYLATNEVLMRAPAGGRWFLTPEHAEASGALVGGALEVTPWTATVPTGTETVLRVPRESAYAGLYWRTEATPAGAVRTTHTWRVVALPTYVERDAPPVPGAATYYPVRVQTAAPPAHGGPGLYVRVDGRATEHTHVRPPAAPAPLPLVDAAPAASLRFTAADRAPYAGARGVTLVWIRGRAFDLREAVGTSAAPGAVRAGFVPDPDGGPHSLWAVQDLEERDPHDPAVPLLRRALVRTVEAAPQEAAPGPFDDRTLVLDGSSTGTLALPARDAATGLPLAWTQRPLGESGSAPPVAVAPFMGRAADDSDRGVYRAAVPDTTQLPIPDPALATALATRETRPYEKADEAAEAVAELTAKIGDVGRGFRKIIHDISEAYVNFAGVTVKWWTASAVQRRLLVELLVRIRDLLRLRQAQTVLSQFPELVRGADTYEAINTYAGPSRTKQQMFDEVNPYLKPVNTLLDQPVTADQRKVMWTDVQVLVDAYTPYWSAFVRELGARAAGMEPSEAQLAAWLAAIPDPVLGMAVGRAFADVRTWPARGQYDDPRLLWLTLPPAGDAWWWFNRALRRPLPTRAYRRTVRPAGWDARVGAAYDPIAPPAWGAAVWLHVPEHAVARWWAAQTPDASRARDPLWLRLWDGEQWAAARVAAADPAVPAATPARFAAARRDLVAWWLRELEAQPGLAGRLPLGPAHTPADLARLYDGDAAADAQRELALSAQWSGDAWLSEPRARARRFLLAAPTRVALQRAGARHAEPPRWTFLGERGGSPRAPEPQGVWLDAPSSTARGPQWADPLDQVLRELEALRVTPAGQRARRMAAFVARTPLQRSAAFVRFDGTPWGRGPGALLTADRNGQPLLSTPLPPGPAFAQAGGRDVHSFAALV